MRNLAAGLVRLLVVTSFASAATAKAESSALYRGIDACRDVREGGRGIDILQAGSAALASAVRNLTVTPAANQAYDFASEVIEDVDFAQVLTSSLAKTLPDGSHAFALSGAPLPSRQRYRIDYHKATASELPTSDFLAFAAELDVRDDKDPVPGEKRGFGITMRSAAGLGEFNHRAAGRLGNGVLRVMAPQNLALLPGSGDLNARILGELEATLPASTLLTRRYLTIEPNATVRQQGGDAHTDLRTSIILNIEQLSKDHPLLGAFIEAMAQKFSIEAKVVYQQDNGLILGEAQVFSTTYQSRLHFKTAHGKLLPYDRSGKTHPEAAIDPSGLQDLAATAVIDVTGEVLGLRFAATNIRVATSFHDAPVAVMNAKLSAMPLPKIEGYALGFVPTWAISAVMVGGSLDDVTRTLTQGLLRGSDGRGTYAVAHLDSRSAGANHADMAASTEMIDNFYLTFGLSVAEKYLWPSREVIADSWHLSQDLALAMQQDMTRLKRFDQADARRGEARYSH